MAEVEKRIAALESVKPINESMLTLFKQDMVKRMEDCEKSMEESLKQFCESTYVNRVYSRQRFLMECNLLQQQQNYIN
jgi:hypothetical protein